MNCIYWVRWKGKIKMYHIRGTASFIINMKYKYSLENITNAS